MHSTTGWLVLRDGVKSAVRIGRSRKAEGLLPYRIQILSWGLQVAIVFQIMSTMALKLPSFLEALEDIRGISPDVQLDYEPWGHIDHSDLCSLFFIVLAGLLIVWRLMYMS